MKKLIFCITFIFVFTSISYAEKTKLSILKYKGGDWYSVIGAVKNFIIKVNELTPLELSEEPEVIELRDRGKLFTLPIIILNGHGQILLDEVEKNNLKEYLENGGFLLVNDDFGMNKSFRMLVEDIFPSLELVELSNSFPLYNSYYKLSSLPKVHEHDGGTPKAFGLFIRKRLTLLYLYNSDIADGWEPESVHHDPFEIRQKAIQFGINILYYILSN